VRVIVEKAACRESEPSAGKSGKIVPRGKAFWVRWIAIGNDFSFHRSVLDYRYEKTEEGKKEILAHDMGNDRDGVASIRRTRENPQTDSEVLSLARRVPGCEMGAIRALAAFTLS
jgi:hypothetical protein